MNVTPGLMPFKHEWSRWYPPYRQAISSLKQAKTIPSLSDVTRALAAQKANCTLGCPNSSTVSRAGEVVLPLYPNMLSLREQIRWNWAPGTACLGCCLQRDTAPPSLSSLSPETWKHCGSSCIAIQTRSYSCGTGMHWAHFQMFSHVTAPSGISSSVPLTKQPWPPRNLLQVLGLHTESSAHCLCLHC